jgi:hypothetical protein
VVADSCWAPELANTTFSPDTGLPYVSLTVAVATDVDEPSAVSEPGLRPTVKAAAGPAVCVNLLVPETSGETEVSVAVMVNVPAVVLDVTVAR